MKFLFHGSTYTKGTFNYWNIYMVKKGYFYFEELNKKCPFVRMHVVNTWWSANLTADSKESSKHILLKYLEEYLIRENKNN